MPLTIITSFDSFPNCFPKQIIIHSPEYILFFSYFDLLHALKPFALLECCFFIDDLVVGFPIEFIEYFLNFYLLRLMKANSTAIEKAFLHLITFVTDDLIQIMFWVIAWGEGRNMREGWTLWELDQLGFECLQFFIHLTILCQ